MNNTSNNLKISVVLGVMILTAAFIVTYFLQNPIFSSAAGTTNFILPPETQNFDIQSSVYDPVSSLKWSGGIINGKICFNSNPPSRGGKYRVEVMMDVKDSPNSNVVVTKQIGGDRQKTVSNPDTLRCDSARRRDDLFAAPFNIPDRSLWTEDCPTITVQVSLEGNWPIAPEQKIARLSRQFLCRNGVPSPQASPATSPSPVASPSPQAGVTRTPVTPVAENPAPQITPSPVQTDASPLSGTISIYSCVKPQDVTLNVCDSSDQSACHLLSLAEKEANDSIWLRTVQGDDRTWLYNYKVSKTSSGTAPAAGSKLYVRDSMATMRTIKNSDTTFTSSPDTHNAITVPGTHDKTIDAQYLTCGCPFRAHTYLKDADTGEILPISDPNVGTSNDILISKFGDKIFQTFNNGVIDVDTDFFRFAERFNSNPFVPYSEHGIDGLAMVRLYAPGYEIVKQECTSLGGTNSCPGGAPIYARDSASPDIKGFRLTCGTNIEYGWVVKKAGGTQNFTVQETGSLFTVAQADVDDNGVVNISDLLTCQDSLGGADATCDLDGNGLVNTTDLMGISGWVGTSVN